jgi:uncharacterized protein (DUF885 family)
MAQNVMGDKFDIKKFNDYLLEDGTLALNIMDKKMYQWIDDNQ